MKKINSILVPVDFTDTSRIAVDEAAALCKALAAELYLVHVIEYNSYNFSIVPNMDTMLPPLPDFMMAVDNKLDWMLNDIETRYSIKPHIFSVQGNIHDEIISYAEEKKISLIVMGTHGTSGYSEMFIGSNAQRVVTLSEVPVLTMQHSKSITAFKKILLPIDNSMHSREKVNVAILFARAFGSEIHILGLPGSSETDDVNKFRIKIESVEKLLTADGIKFSTFMEYDAKLAKAALDFAGTHNCDLIVINTGHESEITGVFLGAFAQQIVNHSPIPVLSCKHTEGHFILGTPGFGVGYDS